jgi:hypothetical protein
VLLTSRQLTAQSLISLNQQHLLATYPEGTQVGQVSLAATSFERFAAASNADITSFFSNAPADAAAAAGGAGGGASGGAPNAPVAAQLAAGDNPEGRAVTAAAWSGEPPRTAAPAAAAAQKTAAAPRQPRQQQLTGFHAADPPPFAAATRPPPSSHHHQQQISLMGMLAGLAGQSGAQARQQLAAAMQQHGLQPLTLEAASPQQRQAGGQHQKPTVREVTEVMEIDFS